MIAINASRCVRSKRNVIVRSIQVHSNIEISGESFQRNDILMATDRIVQSQSVIFLHHRSNREVEGEDEDILLRIREISELLRQEAIVDTQDM